MRRSIVQRGVVASCLGFASACLAFSPGHSSPLAGYRLLVEGRDSLSDLLARDLARRGFSVRRKVSGGTRPTAALVTFPFSDEPRSRVRWLAARLADTRSGVVLAAVTAPVDSLGSTIAMRSRHLADSIAARLRGP